MPTYARALLCCLGLTLMPWAAQAQAAPPEPAQQTAAPDEAAYREAIEGALEEYQLGHFEEARSLFQRAHELDPNARTLRGLGMVEFELRHYVAAAQALEASLADQRKPLTDEQRTAVSELLERARQFTARYALSVEPERAGLVVELDGRPIELDSERPLVLEAGQHELRISAPDVVPRELHIDVKGGEEQTLRVQLELKGGGAIAVVPPEKVRPYRKVGIALMAVGAASLVGTAAFGTLAMVNAKDAVTDDDDQADTARTYGLVSDATLGVGVASLAVGLGLWLVRREKPVDRARIDLEGSNLSVRF